MQKSSEKFREKRRSMLKKASFAKLQHSPLIGRKSDDGSKLLRPLQKEYNNNTCKKKKKNIKKKTTY